MHADMYRAATGYTVAGTRKFVPEGSLLPSMAKDGLQRYSPYLRYVHSISICI